MHPRGTGSLAPGQSRPTRQWDRWLLGDRRSRPHHQDRVGRDRRSGSSHMGSKVGADRDTHRPDIKVVGRLLKGWMGCRGQDHLGLGSAWLPGAGPIASSLDRHQNALGPPRSHVPHRLLVSSQQVRRHRHDFGFKPLQAGKGHGIQTILREEHGVSLFEQVCDLVAGMKDQAPRPTFPPPGIILAQICHGRQHVFGRFSLLRKCNHLWQTPITETKPGTRRSKYYQ